jgi:hypothetical protein
VPNLPNDPGLAKIADKAGFNLEAPLEIDFGAQL